MQVGLGNFPLSALPRQMSAQRVAPRAALVPAAPANEERFVSQLGAFPQSLESERPAVAESVSTGALEPAASPLHPSVQSLVKGLRDSLQDNPDPLLPALASVLENAFSNGQPIKVTGERQLPADLVCGNGQDRVKVQLLPQNRIRLSMQVDTKDRESNRQSYGNLDLGTNMDMLSLDDSFHAIEVDLNRSPTEVKQVAFLKNDWLGNIRGEWFADTSICKPAEDSGAFKARMLDALHQYQPAQNPPGLDLGNFR